MVQHIRVFSALLYDRKIKKGLIFHHHLSLCNNLYIATVLKHEHHSISVKHSYFSKFYLYNLKWKLWARRCRTWLWWWRCCRTVDLSTGFQWIYERRRYLQYKSKVFFFLLVARIYLSMPYKYYILDKSPGVRCGEVSEWIYRTQHIIKRTLTKLFLCMTWMYRLYSSILREWRYILSLASRLD